MLLQIAQENQRQNFSSEVTLRDYHFAEYTYPVINAAMDTLWWPSLQLLLFVCFVYSEGLASNVNISMMPQNKSCLHS